VERATAAVADITAIVEEGAIVAGGRRAGGVASAQARGDVADLTRGAAVGAVEGAAAAIADVATEVEGRTIGAGRGASAGGVTDAEIVEAHPSGRTWLRAFNGPAAAVAEHAAVLPALWMAGELGAGRGHALVVRASLPNGAPAAIAATATTVPDHAAVLADARAAGHRDAGCAALAQIILASPPGARAIATLEGTAAAVAEQAAAVLPTGWIAGGGNAG